MPSRVFLSCRFPQKSGSRHPSVADAPASNAEAFWASRLAGMGYGTDSVANQALLGPKLWCNPFLASPSKRGNMAAGEHTDAVTTWKTSLSHRAVATRTRMLFRRMRVEECLECEGQDGSGEGVRGTNDEDGVEIELANGPCRLVPR
jgi:hypothetical protein